MISKETPFAEEKAGLFTDYFLLLRLLHGKVRNHFAFPQGKKEEHNGRM